MCKVTKQVSWETLALFQRSRAQHYFDSTASAVFSKYSITSLLAVAVKLTATCPPRLREHISSFWVFSVLGQGTGPHSHSSARWLNSAKSQPNKDSVVGSRWILKTQVTGSLSSLPSHSLMWYLAAHALDPHDCSTCDWANRYLSSTFQLGHNSVCLFHLSRRKDKLICVLSVIHSDYGIKWCPPMKDLKCTWR